MILNFLRIILLVLLVLQITVPGSYFQRCEGVQEKFNFLTSNPPRDFVNIDGLFGCEEESRSFLMEALESENVYMQIYAVESIIRSDLRSDDVLYKIINQLKIEKNIDVEIKLIDVLQEFNDGRSLDVLSIKFGNVNENEYVRFKAGSTIAKFGNRESYDILKNFVYDSSIHVRKVALWGLGLSHIPEAKSTLVAVFENKNETLIIRYWAARGLSELEENVDFQRFKNEFDRDFKYEINRGDYVLRTDISYEVLDSVDKEIQRTDALLKTFFNTTKKIEIRPTVLLLFDSEEDFKEYTQIFYPYFQGSGGYIHSENLLLVYDKQSCVETFSLIKHEWTHRFMDVYVHLNYWEGEDFLLHFPAWFDEGMAEYFANSNLDNGEHLIPQIHRDALVQNIKSGKLIKVFNLVGDENPYQFGFRYSEAWALVYFLIHYNEGEYISVIETIITKMKNSDGDLNMVFLNSVNNSGKFQLEWENFIMGLENSNDIDFRSSDCID